MKSLSLSPIAGKPVMIITEYMENGSLDMFLRVRAFRFIQITCTWDAVQTWRKRFVRFPGPLIDQASWLIHFDGRRVTAKSLCFRRMMAASLSSSWWGCWGASRPVWNIYPTWVTFIGTWRLGTFWWTATWCARSPTSGCPECLKMNQKELTPPECVYFDLYTLIHHSCVDV